MIRNISTSVINRQLLTNSRQSFGKITNFFKGMLESLIKEQRDLPSKDLSNVKIVPKNQIEAEKQYIQAQQTISNFEKQRMQRIDEELGTRTFYHQTKIYEERLDSDHIMEISMIKKKYKQPSRSQLDWTNPQAPLKFRVKNRRKYSKSLKKLRSYPQHHEQINNLKDESIKGTIDFLGTQALFTKLSLGSVDLKIQSLQKESLEIDEEPLVTNKYSYFRAPYTHSIYRIDKKKYFPQISRALQSFVQFQGDCQQVVSIDYLYQVLKQFDADERVAEYLKKVENQRINFIVSGITFNENQNEAMIFIDLLDNQSEYCAIYKNFNRSEESMKREGRDNVIFNLKPKGFFQGSNFYYVQRSQEGLYVELAIWNCQSKSQKIIYKCQPYHEMQVASDPKGNFIFIKERQINSPFNQKISILDTSDINDIKLYPLLPFQNCSYQVATNQEGILVAKYKSTENERLKFGFNEKYGKELYLIPFKGERALIQDKQKKAQTENQPEASVEKNFLPIVGRNKMSAAQLDLQNIKIFFKCQQSEYIKDFQARKTHTIVNLTKFSVFNQNRLLFIPKNPNSNSHSIYLEGYPYEFNKIDNQYNSQSLKFRLQTPLMSTNYKYTIWKKQLQQTNQDKIHAQTMNIENQHNKDLKIRILVHRNFVNQKTALVLYCPSLGQKIDQFALRRFLEKGIMVVEFFGRGSLSKDAQYLMQGAGANYLNYVQDLQSVLSFLGNNLSKNISIYTKGGYSSVILLLMNLKFPLLFNSTVLHNGVYDLDDQRVLKAWSILFGQGQQVKAQWSSLNPLTFSDKSNKNESKQLKLGMLQNILISSDSSDRNKLNREQSRKLVLRLRNNRSQKYQQVCLKQHENKNYQTDIYNLAYIYDKIRDSQTWVETDKWGFSILNQEQQAQSKKSEKE